jgi:site-specific DNA-methyltransferase (adenine-specific)
VTIDTRGQAVPRRRPTRASIFRAHSAIEISAVKGGYLSRGDALAFASSLCDGIADIVFVDPPFHLGKDYGVAPWLEHGNEEFYGLYLERVMHHMVRVLKPGGAIFIYHLPYWAARLSRYLLEGLDFRHWIAVSMKNGFPGRTKLYPAHYALLYYTKGAPRSFKRPRIALQKCRHCGKNVKDYGGYTKLVTRNGLNLSDVWDDLSPVRHLSRKHRKANQLPDALTDRVVEIAGQRGGLLVDPFAGTGTSLLSASRYSMAFVGNELSRQSLNICRRRLNLISPRRRITGRAGTTANGKE